MAFDTAVKLLLVILVLSLGWNENERRLERDAARGEAAAARRALAELRTAVGPSPQTSEALLSRAVPVAVENRSGEWMWQERPSRLDNGSRNNESTPPPARHGRH